MYDNIGEKIKTISKAFVGIVISFAVLIGIALVFNSDTAVIGLLVATIVPLIAWFFSLVLYGLGELIEKVCLIEEHTRNKDTKTGTHTNI